MDTLLNNGPAEHIGVVLMPTFTYTKGQLWRLETKAMELLASGSCNIDRAVTVTFKRSVDTRDERPTVCQLRLVLPATKDDKKPRFMSRSSIMWVNSDLLSAGVVSDLPRIKTTDMVEIEPINEESLPMNIEADTHKTAAARHQQLGAPAMSQIWKSLLTPLQKSGQDSMVLVDLTPQTADALAGFLRVRQSLDVPTFYFGLCQNASHKEWIQ